MTDPKEFDEFRPYRDDEVKGVLHELINDRLMNEQMSILVPWLPRFIRNVIVRLSIVGIHTTMDFQLRFMKPIVKYVLRKSSTGTSFDHHLIHAGAERYTFMSNHRDIVLDSAILDLMLHEAHFPTFCEIAIGDNLLIYPWIKKIVKLNKAFTVRRGLSPKELMQSSQLMSRYIHYAVTEKKENVWIAQREGRAKDSDDLTQVKVLKMLCVADGRTPLEQLKELNIVPLTISYEYDPCDFLKAQEFQQKRDAEGGFKKGKDDDETNMRTGIWGFKGHVHYEVSECINTWIDELKDLSRPDFFTAVAKRIDREIHSHYHLYPSNYVAADLLKCSVRFQNHYTTREKERFIQYLDGQIQKVELPNPDEAFLRERILTMYANPVFNKLKALES